MSRSFNFVYALLFTVFFTTTSVTKAQVAIGSTSTSPVPNSKAVLLLEGNGQQGIIIPIVTNKSVVGVTSLEKGMVVFDDSDKTVYYFDGTVNGWKAVGGGASGSQAISINGNLVQLSGTTLSSFPLASAAPTAKGQLLVWDGTKWSSTLAPTTTDQILKWDNTSGAWKLGTDNSGTPIAGNLTSSNAAVTILNGANSVLGTGTTLNIQNASSSQTGLLSQTDFTTFTNKVSGVTATAPLTVTGTSTAPVVNFGGWPSNAAGVLTNNGTGTLSWGIAGLPTLVQGNIFVGNASNVAAGIPMSGDATITSTGAVTVSKLNGTSLSGLSTGILKNTTGTGVPTIAVAGTDYLTPTGNGSGLTNLNATNISSGTLAIANGGTGATTTTAARTNLGLGTLSTLSSVTTTEIIDGTIAGADLANNITINTTGAVTAASFTGNGSGLTGITATPADGSITGGTAGPGVKLAANTITDANISGTAAIADSKLATITTAGKVSGNAITTGTIGGNTNINTTGNITSGAVSATTLAGNGSALTNLNATNISSGTLAIANGGTGATTATAARTNLGLGTLATANTVTTTEITDGTIATADLANGSVTATKLSTVGATNGQIIKYDGTNWVFAADDVGSGSVPTLTNGQVLIGNGTSNSAAALSGDGTLNAGILTLANSSTTRTNLGLGTLATANTVTTTEITDGTIAGADLSSNIAINTTGAVTAASFTGNGSGLTGITATPADGSITGGTAGPGVKLAANTITDANISGTAAIADSKLATITTAGKVSGNAITTGTIGGNTIINTTGAVTAASFTGNGSGLTGITATPADGSITGGTAGPGVKLAANTITDANISGTAAIADSKLATITTAGKVSGNAITTGTIGGNTNINTTGNITSGAVSATTLAGNGSALTNLNATNISSGTLAIANGGTGATTATAARTNLGLGTLATANTVTTTEITDGTIATADLANGSVTATKLSTVGATNGQILKYDGTNWVFAADDVGSGSVPTLTNGQVLIGNGTSNSAAALSGDGTLNAGILTLANSSTTRTNLGLGTLATANTVTTTEITDGTIAGADLSSNIAINTTGAVTAASFTGNGSGLTGITVTPADGSITGGTAGPGVKLAANTITDANISGTAAIVDSKLATITTAGKVSGNAITTGTIGGNTAINTTGAVTAASFTGSAAGLTGFPTLNQNTTGNAATATALATGRTISLTGDVNYTSPTFDGSGNVTAASTVSGINGTSLSGLATGILKNTTGTGVPSIATGADLPVMTATVGGAVPTPPNNTTTFLRGDGTFATPAGGGTVTNIATGTGLTGGPITGSGTISLANTAVTAASYGTSTSVPQITVDAQGRLTAASNVAIPTATTTVTGLLTGADWTTFNGKQDILTLTTTGTSGAATLAGNTLNIPNYAGSAYSAGTGLTLTTNTFDVNTSQNISTLSNLTTNGLIKTSGGTGALSIATAGTDYVATETDPAVKAIIGIVKSNGTTISAATAGTDYLTPTGNGSGLTNLNASNISTGTLAIANGGTGATTAPAARTALGLGSLATLSTVASADITDNTIVDADVNSSAAISGSKINPSFGAQAVSTTSTLTTGSAGQFVVDATGNITKINGATTSFPAANTAGVLTNDGTGTLTWSTSSTTASNGITKTGNDFTLGGVLTGQTDINRAGNDFNIIGAGNFGVRIGPPGTDRLFVDGATGNVGIGTTGPSQALSVSGGIIVDHAGSNNGNFVQSQVLQFGTGSGEGIGSSRIPTQETLDFYTGASKRMTITNTGNIGLGTATPSTTLEVAGQVKITGGTPGLGKVLTSDASGLATWATETDPTVKAINGIVKSNGITISAATAGTDYQAPITLTTTGTSGAATLAGNTLNIPNYAGTAYSAGTGLTLTTNTFDVNTSQNISILSNLTTNGLIKTSGGTGALSIATAGTDFLAPTGNGSGLTNLNASNISTGIVAIANGGTGAITAPTALSNLGGLGNSLTNGNIFVGSVGNVATGVAMGGDATINNTGIVTIANGAISGGTGGKILDATITAADLAVGAVDLTTTDVTGILPTANGGTGSPSITPGGVAYGGASAYVFTPAGISGQLLQSNGGGAPTWVNAPVSGWGLTGNTLTGTERIGSDNAQPLAFETANTERMRIDATGNVGIEITTPSNKMDIAVGTRSGSHGTGLPLYVTGTLGAASSGIEFRDSNGSQGIGFGFNTIYATGSSANQDLGLASRGVSNLLFSTNSTERMRIDAAGNVGIGTTTPLSRLQVGTKLGIFTDASTPQEIVANNIYNDGTNFRYVTTGSASALTLGNERVGLFTFASGTAGNILAGSPSMRFNLTTLGVGIQVDNPQEILHVNGATLLNPIAAPGTTTDRLYNVGGSLFWNGTNISSGGSGWGLTGNTLTGTERIGSDNAQPLAFETANTERMRIDATGNVGIGVTNPVVGLDVFSNNGIRLNSYLGAGSTASGSAYLGANLYQGYANNFWYWANTNGSVGGAAIGLNSSAASNSIQFFRAAGASTANAIAGALQESMRIDASGNVGIGTIAPTQKLDVNGNVNIASTGVLSFGGVGVLNTSGNSNDVYANLRVIRNTSSTVADGLYIGLGNTGGTAGHIRFYTNGTLRMLMDANNGMIGINNASPAYALDVVGGNTTNYFSGMNLVRLDQPAGAAFLASGNFISGITGTSASTTIKASNYVVAEGFLAISDKRIKRDIVVSDASKDLQTLMKLKVRDYHFIDWISRGSQLKKGLIAQEVKEIFPDAVTTKAKEIIPSVYAKAKAVIKGNDDLYSICTPASHGFGVGDKVKLITPQGEIIEQVTSVEGSDCFSLKTTKTLDADNVIVYGKEISDFHSVDYDQVHTLSVSAVQELARKVEAQQQVIDLQQHLMDSLQAQNAESKKKIATLEASLSKVAAGETELATLKSEIEKIKAALGMSASLPAQKEEKGKQK